MAMWARGGRRPAGWHEFERPAGLHIDEDLDNERSVLWRAGLLGADEKAELEHEWREEFEWAHAFGLDAARRRKHFAWADIPVELQQLWSKQRPALDQDHSQAQGADGTRRRRRGSVI
jgi:hypothetical protein